MEFVDAPLKVSLVTETYAPEVNGVAMTLGRTVEGLLARGHQVHLVRPRQHPRDTPAALSRFTETLVAGLPIPRYPGLRFGLPALGALKKRWRASRPDIVHIATEGPLGVSALKAARALGLPVSTSFHTNFDAYSSHYGIGLIRPFIAAHLRRFHNRADTTLVPTRALAGSLQQQGYRNVGLMSRGVDIRLFQPARRSAYLREQWQVDDDTLVVTYIGRIAAEKNIGLVLSAFAEILRQRPNSRLLFVGDGPMLAELVRRHPEHIYAGMRRGEDLAAHYASADLFLFPSLTETFGNVTSEALASGLGVVAYNCAAAAELIEDGHNGFLAAPDDVSDFIQSALRLAADPVLMSRVRMRATASVSRLDWGSVHDEFAATLRRVIDTHERKRLVRDALVTVD